MSAEASQPLSLAETSPRVRELRRFLRVFLGRKIVLLGSVVILTLVVTALFAPLIAPHDPVEQDLRGALQPPSGQHLLGTDSLGRDLLSRIIYGSRASALVGVAAVGIAGAVGVTLGLLAGYLGGLADTLIMRFIDALMAIPPLMLALAIRAALGGGIGNVMLSLGISLVPTYARLMRGQVLTVRSIDFVTAAEAVGGSNLRIMWRHILPNCLPPLIVLVTLNLGTAILAEAGLSFLGLGINPPAAAWGSMVSDGYRYLLTNPLLSFAPGLCIMVVVLAFNFVGDGLRDALDPRLKGIL